MKRLTWTLLRLVTEAKGHNIKEMSFRLREKFPQLEGLGKSAILDKASDGKEAPPEVAKFITSDVEIRPGYEVPAKVVRMGVAAWRGKPSPAMGKRLDALGGKLDAANGKLDTANDKLDSNGGKLDKLLSEVEAIRVLFKVAVHVTTTVLLLGGLGFAGHQLRADVSSAETASATQTPRVGNVVNGATSEAAALLRAALGHLLDLGKKTEEEHWIPKEPASWQKLAKDCDRELREVPINGGCWAQTPGDAPCGTKLFRHGDKCYRPVAADPTKPIGMFPDVPGQQ